MRIDSSTIGMESARSYSRQEKQSFNFTISAMSTKLMGGLLSNMSDSLTFGKENQQGKQEKAGETATEKQAQLEDFRTRINGFSSHRVFGRAMITDDRSLDSKIRSIRQQCIDFIFQALFRGRPRMVENVPSEQSQAATPPQGWPGSFNVMERQVSYEYIETEATSFKAFGIVKTTDGREINFDINIAMTRSFSTFYEEYQIASVAPNFTDPLVINLDSFPAELTDQTFIFDIDGDGELDNVSMLSNKSGYLALDKNGDGTINDGNELFGTASGNGFKDLSVFDKDRNGWIDEADEIWSKLKIWVMEADGSQALYSLAEKNIGAICLANLTTDFALTNEVNAARGMIRNTGLFLYETGAVGSIQQIDVVKYDAVS